MGLDQDHSLPIWRATGTPLALQLPPVPTLGAVLQCRLQLGSKNSIYQHSGPLQCVQHLLKTEGPKGLTRGLPATIAREVPGNALFFLVYEASMFCPGICRGQGQGLPYNFAAAGTFLSTVDKVLLHLAADVAANISRQDSTRHYQLKHSGGNKRLYLCCGMWRLGRHHHVVSSATTGCCQDQNTNCVSGEIGLS